jgi:hypothetical protein
VYIAASESNRIAETLELLRKESVLTVADQNGFVARGGMLDFGADTARVRFEIHRERAERAGLKISARLLAVAHIVDEDAAP